MRIGVVPMVDRSWGGIFQYSEMLLDALADVTPNDEVLILLEEGAVPSPAVDRSAFEVVTVPAQQGPLGRVGATLAARLPSGLVPMARKAFRLGRKAIANDTHADQTAPAAEKIGSLRLDLIIYPVDNHLSYRVAVPYVVAIHDLQHRLQPHLPEFSEASDWEEREVRIRRSIESAVCVLVDSEVGKEDLLALYGDTGIDPGAVIPVPFTTTQLLSASMPAERLQAARDRYRLPSKYLFYPAQFWPHKNHGRIVEALGILKVEYDLPVDVVFVGSHAGGLRDRTFKEMTDIARRAGVVEQIHYLGYVPDEVMPALYQAATGLIMPTFFGPTNIPVLEAFSLGCPVITSDIRGIREQVKDAAVLVDPGSSLSIAQGIRQLVLDDRIRATLVEKGRARISEYTPHDFADRIQTVLDEAKRRTGHSDA